jgi:predicted nuclease of predicted toxin-antitoxin system
LAGRVLLDANVPPAVGEALARYGHDVIVASGDPALEVLNDADLLREATRQDRVLVTFNVADFVELARECAHRNEDHMGIIVIHARTYPRKGVGAIAKALDSLLHSHDDFTNVFLYLQ